MALSDQLSQTAGASLDFGALSMFVHIKCLFVSDFGLDLAEIFISSTFPTMVSVQEKSWPQRPNRLDWLAGLKLPKLKTMLVSNMNRARV